MKSCPQQLLNLALSGELSLHESKQMEEHLDACPVCQGELENLAADETFWQKASHHLSIATKDTENTQAPSQTSDSILVQIHDGQVTSSVRTQESNSEALEALLDSPAHPEMLGQVDQFQIEEEIGRGGCGIVFKGFDSRLNRTVAIKFLAPHLSTSGVARKRFEREARSVAAINHPNVVAIHNVSVSRERPYIVMNYIDGLSLEKRVRGDGFLELKEAAQVAVQIASGLESAHRQGLIHRDIKPANIILCEGSGQAVLTDFGLARAADEMALTQTGWLAGTPHYMSPEQARGEVVDPRSDLFSLGSVLYFMTTGLEPFRGDRPFAVMQSIGKDAHLPACSVNPDVSPSFSKIIDKLLEKDPNDRFQSTSELHHHLESHLAFLNNPIGNSRLPKISTRRDKRRKWLFAISGVIFSCLSIGLALLAGHLLGGPRSPQQPSKKSLAENPTKTIESAKSTINRSDLEFLESLRDVKTFEAIQFELGEIEAEIEMLEQRNDD